MAVPGAFTTVPRRLAESEMYVARYLLDIEEFMDTENGEALIARAFSCVDEERREKAAGVRPRQGRAASLGAGLLLQAAVREATGRVRQGPEFSQEACCVPVKSLDTFEVKRYSVNGLLERLYGKPPVPIAYAYGKEGKPYFRDLPFYFNLSHSGDYVLCVISSEEIGADIQQHCGKNVERLARRFFSEREAAALEQAGEEQEKRERLFYRLWARKEAYGKLTGKGITEALGVDLLPENLPEEAVASKNRSGPGETQAPPGMASGRGGVQISETTVIPGGQRLLWEEYGGIEGYSIALCRYN